MSQILPVHFLFLLFSVCPKNKTAGYLSMSGSGAGNRAMYDQQCFP